MNTLTITIFGDSHCWFLSDVDDHELLIEGFHCNFQYFPFSGKSFDHFLTPKGYRDMQRVVSSGPDYLVVILGGNSISTEVERSTVLDQCSQFYENLYNEYLAVNPNGKIISSQLVMRYNKVPNKYNTPGPDDYRLFRNLVNRKINNIQHKHHMMMVAGPKLDKRKYFNRVGTHLTSEGYWKMFDLMIGSIAFALRKDLLQ